VDQEEDSEGGDDVAGAGDAVLFLKVPCDVLCTFAHAGGVHGRADGGGEGGQQRVRERPGGLAGLEVDQHPADSSSATSLALSYSWFSDRIMSRAFRAVWGSHFFST
jgi:hypothetical protein